MSLEYNDIEQIEAYLNHQMGKKDRTAFEQRLKEEAELRQELEQYRTLLSGFEVLQEEAIGNQMQQWEKEWSEATENDADLIEWYLNNELGEVAAEKVASKIQTEPAFAKKVEAYQSLLEGFGALASTSFSAEMKQWEGKKQSAKLPTAKVRHLRPLLLRVAAAAVILLLIGIGIRQYMGAQYSNSSLVASYYQHPGSTNVMGPDQEEKDAITRQFEEAHQMLKNKEFGEASKAFADLKTALKQASLDDLTLQYLTENTDWNYILAMLGSGEEEQLVLASLEAIIANPDHEYRDKAVSLKEKLNSFWR